MIDMSSWWVGLSREAFWAEAQRRHFRYTRYFSTLWNVDQSAFKHGDKGRKVIEHYRELGWEMGGHEIPRTDSNFDSEYDSPWLDDPRLRQLEVDRAWLEWQHFAFTTWTPDFGLACDWAAQLIVFLKLGRTPTTWERPRFEQWCRDHAVEIQPMLEMIE